MTRVFRARRGPSVLAKPALVGSLKAPGTDLKDQPPPLLVDSCPNGAWELRTKGTPISTIPKVQNAPSQ